ncbi:hypothetical protein Patl1_31865 [Pistacia atlantica]|uniref:Uncharacterized protein n=1 Tax=Pistacia atlantica TaxID=434234 RepID=A0ACC1AQW2_9ROSI|nr:hypothetical protein Patl1_31865 [Pistacia atlantica]
MFSCRLAKQGRALSISNHTNIWTKMQCNSLLDIVECEEREINRFNLSIKYKIKVTSVQELVVLTLLPPHPCLVCTWIPELGIEAKEQLPSGLEAVSTDLQGGDP